MSPGCRSVTNDIDSTAQLRTADSLATLYSGLEVGSKTSRTADNKGAALCGAPPPTLGPAGRSVFETVELLEGVLCHLTLQDIVVSTRVCRQFRNVIAASDSIQRALFKKVNASNAASERWRVGARWRRTPLRGEVMYGSYEKAWFERVGDGYDDNARSKTDEGDPNTFLVARLNPILQECPPKKSPRVPPPSDRSIWLSNLDHSKAPDVCFWSPRGNDVRHQWRMLQDLLRGRLRSWHDMYLSDPPCSTVYLEIWFTLGPVSRRRVTRTVSITRRVNIASGVTFGDIARHLSTGTGASPSWDWSRKRDFRYLKSDDYRLMRDGRPPYTAEESSKHVFGYPGEGQPLAKMLELLSSGQEPLEIKEAYLPEMSLAGMIFPTAKDVEDVHNGTFEVVGGDRWPGSTAA